MSLYSISKTQTTILPVQEKARAEEFGYKMVFLIWFLYLFEPARLFAYYIPVLGSLKWLPTLFLVVAIFYWFNSSVKKYNYTAFTIFLALNLFGTVIAFVNDGNWGIARQINRQIFQFYMLGILTFSYFNDNEKINKLLYLYFLYILYFAIWGILSLKLSPIDHTDPGLRTIVPWHPWLDNRDGFGPLMVIGLAYCFYYYRAVESRRLKLLSLISLILCVAGIILSFGRAVFVAMAITIAFMWYQSKKKIYGMFLLIAAAILIFFTISLISPDNRYWETMQTINNGLSEGTGADRSVLWGWAWREFINYPIFGVGTGNFGIALVKLVPLDEALRHGYTEGRLWGRALHSAPFTILSEYGLVGTLAVVLLIIDFINTNRKNRNFSLALLKGVVSKTHDDRHSHAKTFYYISLALMACFLAFWVNGFFYEIIYTSFLWNLIVINRLLYLNLSMGKNPEIKIAHSY